MCDRSRLGIQLPKGIPKKTGPICGPVAVAALTQRTFGEAWDVFNRRGNWKGWSDDHHIRPALRKLGYSMKTVYKDYGGKERIPLIYWLNDLGGIDGPYLIDAGRHWQVAKWEPKLMNGELFYTWWMVDQLGMKPIYKFWNRGARVMRVYKVKEIKKHG